MWPFSVWQIIEVAIPVIFEVSDMFNPSAFLIDFIAFPLWHSPLLLEIEELYKLIEKRIYEKEELDSDLILKNIS